MLLLVALAVSLLVVLGYVILGGLGFILAYWEVILIAAILAVVIVKVIQKKRK